MTLALRALRAVSAGIARRARPSEGERAEILGDRPVAEDDQLGTCGRGGRAASWRRFRLHGHGGAQPLDEDPVDLYRAGKEALLAANVAEAEGRATLAFEATGAYRLLLPAMSEDPGELERFYEETVPRWPPTTSSTRPTS